jgi:hypothetical protein
MPRTESEAIKLAAQHLGHKVFIALGPTHSNGASNYLLRFEVNYTVRFVTDSATDAILYALNNQPA